MELSIGTVQLGMDCGIKGCRKPSEKDAIDILDCAISNGIRAIDTARAYGTDEEVVGKFLEKKTIGRDWLFIRS